MTAHFPPPPFTEQYVRHMEMLAALEAPRRAAPPLNVYEEPVAAPVAPPEARQQPAPAPRVADPFEQFNVPHEPQAYDPPAVWPDELRKQPRQAARVETRPRAEPQAPFNAPSPYESRAEVQPPVQTHAPLQGEHRPAARPPVYDHAPMRQMPIPTGAIHAAPAPVTTRRDPRMEPATMAPVQVGEEMKIAWQGVEYPVAHWDVHGFDLAASMPRVLSPGPGRLSEITLLIGHGGTRIEMRVQARARDTVADGPTRFDFVDLDRAQAEVLHRIVDASVSDQAMSLTRLLNETQDTRTARTETSDRMRGFRTMFQLGLAATVLAVAGLMTWSSFATIRARYAAVTVGATSVSVPVSGRLYAMSVQPGQAVAEGEVLGFVRPSDQDERVDAVIQRRRALEVELAEMRARRGAMGQLADIAVQGNDTERTRLEQNLLLAERRLLLEQDQLAALQSTGLPTASRQRDRARQESVVLDAERDVLDVRARLDTLTRSDVLAPLGVLQGGMNNSAPTLDTVDLRLANLAEEIDTLYQREALAQNGEPILSPCDCVVQQIDRRPGEWAEPTDQLAVLVGSEAPTIHALVPSESARSVELGDRAQIDLADGTRVTGRVARMNYEARWVGYTGLQDNVFAANRYARVEITPDTAINAPIGMVAEVRVHTSDLFATLIDFVGL